MPMTYQEAGRELASIRRLPYGTARTAAAEAITRQIEADGPRERLPEALLDLVEAYTFSDEGHKSFVPFARLLRVWDANPEFFDKADRRNLFWEYKWVAGDLSDYLEIGREQAEEFLAEMGRRFDLGGLSRRAVANMEFGWAWHTGSPDAEAARLRWLTLPTDEMDSCQACCVGKQTAFFLENGRFAEAIEVGATQRDKCNLEPADTCSSLALAYLEVGELEAAVAAPRRVLATIDTATSDFGRARGQEFELLARGHHVDRALLRLRSEYPNLLKKACSPLVRMLFLLGVLAGLSANLDQPDLPTGLPDESMGTLGELHAWVAAEVTQWAAKFDERDGNDYYARLLARALGAKRAGVLNFDTPLVPAAAVASVPSGSSVPAVAPTSTAEPETPAQRAERLAAAKDFLAAAQAYAEAADAADDAGLLLDAGLAWAESAHCAEATSDDQLAHGRYLLALPLLQAADASVDLLTEVLVAWAPVAARVVDPAPVMNAIDAVRHRFDTEDLSGLSDKLAAKRRAKLARMEASLSDTMARLIASLPPAQRTPGRELSDAIALATSAGEEFAHAQAVADAAHAFWLAGRLHRDAGATEDALWALESAFEGFTMTRQRAARAEVGGDFIELLRATGQFAKADEIIASLS